MAPASDPPDLVDLEARAERGELLVQWVVYESPADYPGKFVARRWIIDRARGPVMTPTLHVAASLPEVRLPLIERGLHCMPRFLDDLPHILEVWI